MSNDSEARTAIEKFNGQDFGGRPMTVNEARPKEERPAGGFGGGGGFNLGGMMTGNPYYGQKF